jgi:hypothetical protein
LNAIHGRALRRRYGFVDSERYASEEEGMKDFAGAHYQHKKQEHACFVEHC